jgi:hypothetical protein
MILKWIPKKCGVRMWTGFVWLKQVPVVGSCKNGNEPSDPIQRGGIS